MSIGGRWLCIHMDDQIQIVDAWDEVPGNSHLPEMALLLCEELESALMEKALTLKGARPLTNMSKTKCPKLIVLCCGKRKSGKDYLTDQLQARFLDAQPVIIRLSGPLKECYAKDRGLDFQQLLNASDYKEKYRLDMIKWSEKIRNEDHGYFCRAAIAKYEAINYPVWIVSDCRRKTDFQFFQQEYPGQMEVLHISGDTNTESTQDTSEDVDPRSIAIQGVPLEHDYCVRQVDPNELDRLKQVSNDPPDASTSTDCLSEESVGVDAQFAKKFAKCDKCRRSRTKVLVPNSLLSIASGKNDGMTCDFCGTIMSQNAPQTLPNVFEGRRGSKGGDSLKECSKTKQKVYVYCGECSKVVLKESLSKHMKDVHNKTNKRPCKYCDKVLSGTFSLREHIDAVHFKKSKHNCQYCDRTFAHFSNVNRHIRLVHQQMVVTHKYVNCSVCNKVVQSTSLKKHMKSIHDKLREFQCPHCEKSFAQSYTLKEHIGARHTNDLCHTCLLCQKSFAHKTNCGRHIKSVHKNDVGQYKSDIDMIKDCMQSRASTLDIKALIMK
eukprot:maker-scaffold22_size673200-snap-gene-5.43 protein:Tk12699 transcript:maker-scaffold22_size673200-snap-gene-5.43-mRNA-1 annotation:"phosphomevalonate kinase-like"